MTDTMEQLKLEFPQVIFSDATTDTGKMILVANWFDKNHNEEKSSQMEVHLDTDEQSRVRILRQLAGYVLSPPDDEENGDKT